MSTLSAAETQAARVSVFGEMLEALEDTVLAPPRRCETPDWLQDYIERFKAVVSALQSGEA